MRPIHEMLLQAQGHARFHMPGHKGALDPFDMTELPSTDDLYHPQGAIRERSAGSPKQRARETPSCSRRGDRRQPYDAAVRLHALPRHPHGAHRARERGFRPGAGRYGSGRKRRGLCHPAGLFWPRRRAAQSGSVAGGRSARRAFQLVGFAAQRRRLGADLWVQSAHKTLPALTGGAWLLMKDARLYPQLLHLLRMVMTSSPPFPFCARWTTRAP